MTKVILQIQDYAKNFTLHVQGGKVIRALHEVNLTLQTGEVVGLVGQSGSGKSTLMKSIYRTYIASRGAMHYHSPIYGVVDLVQADDHLMLALRREEITYCSQFLSVIPRVTARDVVAESLTRKGTSWTYAQKIAQEHLLQLGLPEELCEAYPATFSGGEQQRVNIARAIIARPRLLLVDEPTASLDIKSKGVVIQLIKELSQQGTAVLCITHDKYTLDHLANRVVEVKQGSVG